MSIAEVFSKVFLRGGKVLFYGIGNPSRGDDAAAISFIEELEGNNKNLNCTFESNYQLNVEDALIISEFDLVFFVDATREPIKEYKIFPLEAQSDFSYTSHAMSASAVLGLCHRFYDKYPECYMVALPGAHWGLGKKMSKKTSSQVKIAAREFNNLIYSNNGLPHSPR